MPGRKSMPPQRPPRPANAGEGAARVRQFTVELFDRQDGHGVDWRMIDEILFRAAFDVLDRLPDDDRRAVARRVHAGAYDRASGGCADGSGAGPEVMADADAAPSNAGVGRQAHPRPPR
jgi:hypothetical protein